MTRLNRAYLYVDFNEMLEPDLVLLSRADFKTDKFGNLAQLTEGLAVSIYMDDIGDDGRPDNLIADGVVEQNRYGGWAKDVKWCCRIDTNGIRHESDL